MQIPKDKINQVIRTKNFKYFLGLLACIFGVIFLFFALTSPKNNAIKKQKNKETLLSGPVSFDFTEKKNEQAIEKDQNRIDDLDKKFDDLSKKLNTVFTEANARMNEDSSAIKQLSEAVKETNIQKAAPINLSQSVVTQKAISGNMDALNANPSAVPDEFNLQTFEFHYDKKTDSQKNSSAKMVMTGTFVKAVLLSGADADASVDAQSNTDPILLRLLEDGIMPNGKHAHLKGCFVTASVYGDISSERGQIRTQRLSCIDPSSKKLDISVYGTVVGSAGKDGLRGIPAMRNGPILKWSGLSGFFGEAGQAMQQAQKTQSVSPLGSTETVKSNQTLQASMYGGGGTSLSKLSDYYMKRADQYHPIIQINPGSLATVVFLKPFFMDFDQDGQESTQKQSLHTNNDDALLSATDMPSFANHLENSISNFQGGHS